MPHKRAKHSAREQTRSQQGADLAPSKQSLRTEAIPKGAARILNAAKVQQEWHDRKRKSSEDGPREAGDGKAKKRKRKAADDGGDGNNGGGGEGGKVKIMPGESLSHFNRRVEDSMRPLVRTAVKTSAATTRRTKKEEEEAAAASAQAKKAKRAAATAAAAGDAGSDAEPAASSSQPAEPKPAAPAPAKRPKTYDDSDTRVVKHFAAVSTSAPRRLNDIVLAPPELKRLPRGATARKAAAGTGAGGGAGLRESMLSMAQKVMLEGEREHAIRAYRELKRRRTDG